MRRLSFLSSVPEHEHLVVLDYFNISFNDVSFKALDNCAYISVLNAQTMQLLRLQGTLSLLIYFLLHEIERLLRFLG